MPSSSFSESVVEDATLDWFAELGYTVAHGPDLAPDGIAAERASYGDVVLVDRLRAALARINPHVPADTLDEALRYLLNIVLIAPEERYLKNKFGEEYLAYVAYVRRWLGRK